MYLDMLARLALLSTMLLLTSCEKEVANSSLKYSDTPPSGVSASYRLAPHPLYNPQKLGTAIQPLVDYLNQRVPEVHLELESSRDYQAFEQKFRERGPQILMPNPWQTIEAIKAGYHVIAMWGDAEDFKGIIIVRVDSRISLPADLKGKIVCYPSPTALAAAMMPQYFLHQHGIDVQHDIQNVYVGSQESSIMNVLLKKADAGATWPPPWRLFQKEHPSEAAHLRVAWETPFLINNSVMVRDDVPKTVRVEIQKALLDLETAPDGKDILKAMETARFHSASDASYDVVKHYVAKFEKEVRPVELK
jgi:phosphonate transport system substrate-binding protein